MCGLASFLQPFAQKERFFQTANKGEKRAYTIEFEGENRIQRVSQSPTYQGIELGIRLAGT